MIGLSGRQAQVYTLIRAHLDADQPPPTLREMGRQLGISGVSVCGHLIALERKGLIVRQKHRNRNIALPDHCPTCGADLGKVRVTVENQA